MRPEISSRRLRHALLQIVDAERLEYKQMIA
jgi:hypothetical protein